MSTREPDAKLDLDAIRRESEGADVESIPDPELIPREIPVTVSHPDPQTNTLRSCGVVSRIMDRDAVAAAARTRAAIAGRLTASWDMLAPEDRNRVYMLGTVMHQLVLPDDGSGKWLIDAAMEDFELLTRLHAVCEVHADRYRFRDGGPGQEATWRGDVVAPALEPADDGKQ